ncbi:hypothetical protein Tco_1233206 [Tanacetum coccineum]
MTTAAAQKVALDNALVPPKKRVEIGKCNMRINLEKTQKEPTYQVVLDALALTTCYPAFLITADVPEIYMHQFWFTINKKDSTAYRFKIDKKRYRIDMEVFREIFLICPKLPNQEFDALPSDEEIVSFIKELRNKGDIKSITEVVVDQIAQILWGMFYMKNVNFVELHWEDFTFQIDNRDHKKQEKMYYPRFTKAIIHHFITKDKSISMRNRMFMHTAEDDNILGPMRFVSKADDYQVYGTLLPKVMTNQKMQESHAYKTYLAFTTGAASPKKARKFKKSASPSKKRTFVTAQVKEVLKRSRRETTIHKECGSGDGTGSKLGVPDEPKGKSGDTNEGTGLKLRVPDVSKSDSSISEYESWGDSGDEANVQDAEQDDKGEDDAKQAQVDQEAVIVQD